VAGQVRGAKLVAAQRGGRRPTHVTTKTTIKRTTKTTAKRSAPRPKQSEDGSQITSFDLGADLFDTELRVSDRTCRQLYRQDLAVAEETAHAQVAWVLSAVKRSRRFRGKTIDEVVASIDDDASTDFLEIEARRAQIALANRR
jgi:hypothetical protein